MIMHAALRRKSDSRNALADLKHCVSNPADSIRSLSESRIDSLSSMMAINMDVRPPWHVANPVSLDLTPNAGLFTAGANGCKWNSGDFAMKC